MIGQDSVQFLRAVKQYIAGHSPKSSGTSHCQGEPGATRAAVSKWTEKGGSERRRYRDRKEDKITERVAGRPQVAMDGQETLDPGARSTWKQQMRR